jgi:hypothetical protein
MGRWRRAGVVDLISRAANLVRVGGALPSLLCSADWPLGTVPTGLQMAENVRQTSSAGFSRARKTKWRLNYFSLSGGNSGLPVGLTMPPGWDSAERADLVGDRNHRADLGTWDLQPFDFLADRSAAASPGASF